MTTAALHNKARFLFVGSITCLALLTAGCFRDAPAPATAPSSATPQAIEADPRVIALPTVQATIGGKVFTLEVADDDNERSQGLMYRKTMPADHGMIFVWDYPDWRSFYMKNTEIPLDILYLDSNNKIVSINQMQPHDLTSVISGQPAQSAVELNQGVARQLNLRLGDVVVVKSAAK